MKAKRFEREKRYQVMMAICRNMLRQGVLSEADFDEAEIKKRYQRFSSFDWNYGKSVPCTFE